MEWRCAYSDENYQLFRFKITTRSDQIYQGVGAKRRWWFDFYSKGSFCVNEERFFLIDSPLRLIL